MCVLLMRILWKFFFYEFNFSWKPFYVFPKGSSFNDLSSGSTGVFIGASSNDGHDLLSAEDPNTFSGYEMSGGNRAMLSNRLSYTFNLKGDNH